MIKSLKPTTASNRHTVNIKTEGLSTDEIPNRLIKHVKYGAGRSNGKVTVRHKGGRVKRLYRVIDFKRDKHNIEGEVEGIFYDPNRTSNIALIKYVDGERRFILATKNMKVGTKIMSGDEAPINEGNSMPLKRIPSGSMIHNVELKKGNGGLLGRSAGVSIQKQGDVKNYVQVKMPSGEIRLIHGENYATLGEIGNGEYVNKKTGKAGRNRKAGIRPSVRGVAMSWKHPHGGGQGKSGRVHPGGPAKTPWGKKQQAKTRRNKQTNKFIIRRRTSKQRPHVGKYKTIV